MSCPISDIHLKNDTTGKFKEIIEDLYGGNEFKAQVLATYFENEGFRKYVKSRTQKDNLNDVNKATLRKLVNDYYIESHAHVEATITRRQSNSFNYGFTDIASLRQAKDHTADELLKELFNSSVRGENINTNAITKQVIKNIINTFIDDYAYNLYKELGNKHPFIKKYGETIEKFINDKTDFLAQKEAKIKERNAIKDKTEESLARKREINAEIIRLENRIAIGENGLFKLLKYMCDNYGDTVSKNYANLVFQLKSDPNTWFEEVFTIARLTKYKREFENTIENESIEVDYTEDDHDNFLNAEDDSTNLDSRRWADETNSHTSFTQLTAIDVKLYFSTIPELLSAEKVKIGDKEFWNYDKNNPLKTNTMMGADFILTQLQNFGVFDSVENFIESIRRAATQVKGLEGLIKVVEDMQNNPILANRIFSEVCTFKVNKSIIDIENGDIKHHQSNAAIDPITYIIYMLENGAKFTLKDSFSINDKHEVENIIVKLKDTVIDDENINFKTVQNYEITALRILAKYFPKIDNNAVITYLHTSNTGNRANNYKKLFNIINDLINQAEAVLKEETALREAYNKAMSSWRRDLEAEVRNPKPIFDYEKIPYEKLHSPIIELSKLLTPYIAVRNELNSFNAEGNLGSDLLGNNYIGNFIKDLNYSTPDDEFAGLRRLGNFVVNVPQYNNSPIFWGVYDKDGKELIPGLFIRTDKGFDVNPKAKQVISISLFSGIRNQDAGTNALYTKMSKGDYFLSNIIAFFEPLRTVLQHDIPDIGGFFLRTPSDAPKNFIINSKIANIDGLFDLIPESRNAYILAKYNELINKLNAVSERPYKQIEINKNNKYSFDELINEILNLGESFDYTGMRAMKKENKIIVPLVYKTKDSHITVYLTGEKDTTVKKNIIKNVKIESTYIANKSFTENEKQQLANIFSAQGVEAGAIATSVNENHGLFLGFKQHLYTELYNLIYNLNNVFEQTTDKNGIRIYKLKTDINGLFDRYHRSGNTIAKDGKLVGKVFSLNRLFTANGLNVGERLLEAIHLYGQTNEAIITGTNENLSINLNNPFILEVDGEITLDKNAVDNLLNEAVKDWIINFVEDIRIESQQYKTIIGDRYNQSQINNAILNAALMEMNLDDLFEGDSKFYKNTRDFFKRAKEIQASGKAYSGFNFNSRMGGEIMPIQNRGQNVTYKIGDIEIPIEDGFRAVTIKNTVRPSDNKENIYKELLEVNKDLPESTRQRIAFQIARGFGYNSNKNDTTTNDAQSYITIEEWIRRRYLDGTIDQYKDILPLLLDKNANISKIDIGKINKFIQVQKNFYFDRQFDQETNTVYARQIKNAEFVLIPALIKGTSLETLYDAMKAANLGQVNTVETDKAAKRTILEFWDNNGKVSEEAKNKFIEDIKQPRNVESYYYRYLYKQQDVAQHMQDKMNKAGIQIMKKILDNSNSAVQHHIDTFFNNYIANIKTDFKTFVKSMGWTYYEDENGAIHVGSHTEVGLDFTKFYKKAKDEAARLGLDSNFLDYLTTDVFGNPLMPNYMNIASIKLESIAQSMFNSAITRQKLPGWHAAQVTNVGYDSNLKYHQGYLLTSKMTSDTFITDEQYNALFDEEKVNYTKAAYAEVRIPRWSKKIPKVKPGSEKEKALIANLEKEGLDLHIGYRIPTEGKQSVSILKVVGFLDDIQGSTIIVPDEWVTQTGSDFDVDSVYGINFEIEVQKDGYLKKVGIIHDDKDDPIKSVRLRYKKKIVADVRALIDENKQKVYIDLSTDAHEIKTGNDVQKLFATNSGFEFLVDRLGLMTFEEFSALSFEEQQSKAARNNAILQSMINILQHESSREENYSRSNFDNLSDAKDEIDELANSFYGQESKDESTYNPLDQINLMENAMSGYSLKATSVNRDTFNSVCNRTRATLNKNNAITVVYDLTTKDKYGSPLYNITDIINAYGKENVKVDGNLVTVKHYMIGHSFTNRNVVGMLVTPYSSQTTSHILDAIKVGSVRNENMYTFGAFKTLVDLGIDYRTAIAFLQQPAITEIVNAYNETNSVYSDITGNPIHIAINRIAAKLGITVNGQPITDSTSVYSVYEALSQNERVQKAFEKLTGGRIIENGTLNKGLITLNVNRLINRFNAADKQNNYLKYSIELGVEDLCNIMFFAKLNATANNLEKIRQCTNPDRFGAKQSVFATRKIINNIRDYLTIKDEIGNTILVNNISILEAIYPNIKYSDNIDIKNSSYPYLAAFLKYSTIQSININKQLFKLESDKLFDILVNIENKLGITFTEDQAREVQQYFVTDIYNSIECLFTLMTVRADGMFETLSDVIYGKTENSTYWKNEIDRLNGYQQFGDPNINIKNINNPTDEELKQWALLSPVNKIVWILNHFDVGHQGIFQYLNVNRWKGKDIIRYNDTIGDIETLYIEFTNSFFNSNKLIKLAALDLIKYAFLVEGFKFKKGGISKIVPNETLIADGEHKGLSLLEQIEAAFALKENMLMDKDETNKFVTKFIRSHSKYIKPIYVGKQNKNTFAEYIENSFTDDGIMVIPKNDSESSKIIFNKFGIILDKNNNIENEKSFIILNRKIGRNRQTILYKLVQSDNYVYGYPLNLLEENEVVEHSYNNENNKFMPEDYFRARINRADISGYTIPEHKKITDYDNTLDLTTVLKLQESSNPFDVAVGNKIMTDIANKFKTTLQRGMINSNIIHNESFQLKRIIPYNSFSLQYLTYNNENVLFRIERYKPSKNFIKALNGNEKVFTQLNSYEKDIIKDVKDSGIKINPTLYKFSLATQKDVDEFFKQNTETNENDEDNVRYSVIPLIDDSNLNITHEFDSIDQVAVDVANSIYDDNSRLKTDNTTAFIEVMESIGLDRKSTDSVHDYKKEVYREAAKYYENKAAQIMKDIDDIKIIDDEGEYGIIDDKFYKLLGENPETYNHLVKLILQSYNFGKQFAGIYTLDLKGEDEVLTADIEKLKKAIRSITDNNKIKTAMKNIFDIYMAEEYSNNPNIRHGLLNLRETFGDTDWWDLHFSDIGFVNNNQVQTVVRYVNSKLNAVSRFTVPKLLDEFEEAYEDIMKHAGVLDMNHVVDEYGNIIRDYTKDYIEKRKELLKKVADARDTYGIVSEEYWQTKLEKDEWFAKNVHQELVKEYYDKINTATRFVFENAQEEFLAYQRLLSELRAIGNNYKELSYDQLLARKEILNQLSLFTSKFNEDGSEKPIDVQYRLKLINDYKESKKRINNAYYDTKVIDEIQERINKFVDTIKQYDESHPNVTFEEKLKNDTYKDAYEWLQYNTTYSIDTESNEKLMEAYAKFNNGENDRRIRIAGILRGKDVYKKDVQGNLILDPSKISLEDMKKIKALYDNEAEKYYENEDAEYKLISVIPRKRIIGTNEYYQRLKNILGDNSERNGARDRTIKKINKYLIKAIDNNGQFDIELLFKNNTEEELNQLAELIQDYNNIEDIDSLSIEQKSALAEMRDKVSDNKAFRLHESWAKRNLDDTKLDLFYNIFAARTKKGGFYKRKGRFIANNLFYTYSTINEDYVDNDKTDAINFINENVGYEAIPEYYETRDKMRSLATARGDENVYNEWFSINHIYNSYTHKYEPLSIWTKRKIKPNGSLNATYEYNPLYEDTFRVPKEDSINVEFNSDSYDNYNHNTGEYNTTVNRTDAEKKMAQLFQRVLDAQAGNKKLERMARDGFMPRRAKIIKDKMWLAKQAAASLGLDWISYKDRNYSNTVDYTTDREGDFNMASLLRSKGTINIEGMKKELTESDEDFAKRVQEVKENNAAIDKEIQDRDWFSVMKDYIERATMYNAKEELKNTALLLIEDLKHNEANKINYRNKVSMSRRRSTSHNEVANIEPQLNTTEIVEIWYRRVFRDEFKKKHNYNEFASLMQNLTSAKYMIFNVTGGIANVWTGVWNIMGETLAENHFNNKEFLEANAQYMANIPKFFAEMYSEKSSSLINALIKRFNVVNYEEMSERRPNETTSEYIKRFRNWMYGLQSGGEHYMQNTVLLAMLKSHRIYQDSDGKLAIGSLQNYIWEIERQTIKEIISKDDILKDQYNSFINDIKNNKEELYKLETLKEDLNIKFLRALADDNITKEYIKLKKENINAAKEKFKFFDTLESKFKLENGRAVLIDDTISDTILGYFTNKVIYVNKEIHGVYDKIGAATIEREWFGSLVMQYHKHLYPGIMKRFRINGYYNEQTNSYQKGSYISAINLLTIDFDKAFKVAKDDADGKKVIIAVKSIQNICKQIVTNLTHLNTNWAMLPEWERNNVKKALADQLNILSCIVMAIGIHAVWDDDEIKDSNTISTAVYLANRFYSEASTFTPWGAVSEAKTLYSSPIAATNHPQDIIKLIGLTGQLLFDSNFDSNYSTGLYKGRNKFEVLITRNIPIIRVKNRLEMMSKNNQYYRLNSNTMNFVPVSEIGDFIAGRN